MHKLYITLIVIVSSITLLFFDVNTHAADGNVVISQIQTRSVTGGTASEELIEIYNNSDFDIEITDWCVNYGSSGVLNPTKVLGCFKPFVTPSENQVFLLKRSSAILASKAYSEANIGFGYDMQFSSGLSDSDRWLSITDKNNIAIDRVEWGNAINSITAEGGKAASVLASKIIQRKTNVDGVFIDTDNNFNDFEHTLPRVVYQHGNIYEVEDVCVNIAGMQSTVPDNYIYDLDTKTCSEPVDVCPNLGGIQSIVMDGYGLNDVGDCVPDICYNIDGIQPTMPDSMEYDQMDACVYHDECLNLNDIQSVLPVGYKQLADGSCLLDLNQILISEMLPNVEGTDEGNEFIEIYNPNNFDIDLTNYVIRIKSTSEKQYSFPSGSFIKASEYLTFSNSEIGFTLLNTSSTVEIWSVDGLMIDAAPAYTSPNEDWSWAKINDIWAYTNRPTPDEANLISYTDLVKAEVVEVELVPCAANQYRNPETNRCNLIEAAVSELVPCKVGQYRSEETNRCRNIASDASILAPCAEGQERNPVTNRCRNIVLASANTDLVPCREGQERNPETNRCRNIIVASIPTVGFAPEAVNGSSGNNIVWWSLATLGIVAVSYGIWEWRFEITKFAKMAISLINPTK